SAILISHLLGEILDYSDRVVVMRDGKVVAADGARAFDRDKLVAAMGAAARHESARVGRATERSRGGTPLRVRARPERQRDAQEILAQGGEIIGLAGLAGHGQTQLLLRIFDGARRRIPGIMVTAPVALIAGDRQSDGIFPLWSIAENIGIASIAT